MPAAILQAFLLVSSFFHLIMALRMLSTVPVLEHAWKYLRSTRLRHCRASSWWSKALYLRPQAATEIFLSKNNNIDCKPGCLLQPGANNSWLTQTERAVQQCRDATAYACESFTYCGKRPASYLQHSPWTVKSRIFPQQLIQKLVKARTRYRRVGNSDDMPCYLVLGESMQKYCWELGHIEIYSAYLIPHATFCCLAGLAIRSSA